jgi:TolB-like protein
MILLSGYVGAQQGGQRTGERIDRIAVIPFVNTTDLQQWDNLARDMTETMRLTLALGERFDVVNPDTTGVDPYAPDGPLQLRRIADARRIDGAVIGRISDGDNDRIELETSVWSNATGQIIGGERREAFGSFDILDAADELVALTSSALLGYQVDFGAIILNPSRSDVGYSVSIDGHPVGTGIRSIPQVLVGQRRIEISVEVAGREQLVYSAERRIRPGEAIEVTFGLPQVTRQEQREILVRQELATNLLGQPENFRVAFEALSESRSLLATARSSETTEVLKERQNTLERAWQLDEEFFRLSISDIQQTEIEEGALSGTYRLIGSGLPSDPTLKDRAQRNGAAYYHLLRILWADDLGESRWEAAQSRLETMQRVVDQFELDWLADEVSSDTQSYRSALEESERARMRRRRPWPYIGTILGLAGMGAGGYVVASQEGLIPDTWDPFGGQDFVNSDFLQRVGREFSRSDALQWGTIGVGGAITVISTALLVRNLRADENYLRDWARTEYGFEIDRAAEILETVDTAEEGDAATIVVVGPAARLVAIGGEPRSLPLIVEQDPGLPIATDAPAVVSDERTRLFEQGVSLMVIR